MSYLTIGERDDEGPSSSPVEIDLDQYIEQGLRVGIFAASGSGKGWLLGVLLEEFIEAGLPIIAIDPESELWTFQEAGALVLGGPHGDVPLPRTDEGVRKAIEFGVAFRTPIIFDLGGVRGSVNLLREGERISSILWDIADSSRTRIVFAVTEAEVFAPQSVPKTGPQPEMLATINKRGRKRGVAVLLETQRPADIANAVITQCNVRLIGRMDDTADYDRVKRYVTPMTFTQMHRLQTGHFMLDGEEVAVRARRVTHGGGTPIGGEIALAQRPTPEGLADIIAGLREPEVEVDLPTTAAEVKAAGNSVAGMVARADLDRVEERLRLAERTATTLRSESAAKDATLTSLEREVERLRADVIRGDRAIDTLAALRAALVPVLGELPSMDVRVGLPDGSTLSSLSEEDVKRLIRLHAPAGGPSAPSLLPVEALRARYLEAAAQRLVAAVEALEADERDVLLFLLPQTKFLTINAIQKGVSGTEGGDGRKRWEKALVPLVRLGLVKTGSSGGMGRQQDVDAWVAKGLAPHEPTAEELAQVKNRALSVVMSR